MDSLNQFSAIATRERIDGGSGIIYGVSVITKGEAQGKNAGTWIDDKTLSQICSVAKTYTDGVKVKLSESKEHDGSVGQVCGALKNFTISGNRVRADLHLLKSDKSYDKILEMSSTMPSEFGLSVVIPKEIEKVNGKECLRCSEIYSIDLVEAPAANPTGLFSQQPTSSMSIKYAKGDSGEHAADCECKECMSKHSKKEMTALLASFLGLDAEKATEDEIKAAFAKKPKAPETPENDDDENSTDKEGEKKKASKKEAEHEKKMSALSARVDAFEASAAAAVLSAKKTEIATLVADASREGKVIPLTDEQLAKMDIPDIKAMFSKLISGQVKQAGKRLMAPVSSDGKPVRFTTEEDRIEFCRAKQEEGAAALTAQFMADPTLGLTRN